MHALHWPALLEIAARTAIVYVALLVGVRLAGKREIGQLTPFDLVVLLLISNAVQNAMTGPDTSLTGGIVSAATLLLINSAIAQARLYSAPFRRFVEGIPIVLVNHGEIQFRNLRKEKMTIEELEAVLREHEAKSVDQVELAMLEVDGSVSVIRKQSEGSSGRLVHSRRPLTHHSKRPN